MAIHGEASQELPSPAHFEQLTASVTEEQVAEHRPVRPRRRATPGQIAEYVDAGYDHVYIHQIGPDQAGFIKFAEGELLPALKPGACVSPADLTPEALAGPVGRRQPSRRSKTPDRVARSGVSRAVDVGPEDARRLGSIPPAHRRFLRGSAPRSNGPRSGRPLEA